MKINKFYNIYFFSLIFFGSSFLYLKHYGGLDSSISDWLINYSGGFVRRGFSGQIAIYLSNFLNIELRKSILILQLLVFISFNILVYNYFKNIIFNRIIFLAVFCPLFVLYPVAETEALGRKELIIFIIVITYFFTDIKKKSNQFFFKTIIFPLAILIWEPIVFFFSYIFLIEILSQSQSLSKEKFIKLILSYIFVFLTFLYVYLNPITELNFLIMKNFLSSNFNEICYLSCKFVGNQSQNTFYELMVFNISHVKISYIIRYLLIILIGFYPLFFLIKNSQFEETNKPNFKFFNKIKIHYLFSLAFIPSLILYLIMYDWGRIVHVSYTFMLLSFFHLIRTKKVIINSEKVKRSIINKISGKTFIIFVIIFCLGWHPKVVISEDVASKPVYTIPYKFYKYFIKN